MGAKLVPVLRDSPPVSRPMQHGGSAVRSEARPDEERALVFLGEVLSGDSEWEIGEVQRLIALHTVAALGRWHADGLDGPLPEV